MEKKSIRQLVLSTYDKEGGASRSTYRIFEALRNVLDESRMLVQFKSSIEPSVIAPDTSFQKIIGKIRTRIDLLPLRKYKKFAGTPWSIGWFPHNISKKIKKINPDIVNLNWVGRGFLPISELPRIKYPVIWTLHDMWAFTGGCHYAFDCKEYINSCGHCPQLESDSKNDLSRSIWEKKEKAWKNLDMTIISPSRWLADCAKESSLFKNFRIEVIPYTIDTRVFKPINKSIAKTILNIPAEKKVILFGGLSATTDKRKGIQHLIPAIKILEDYGIYEYAELLIFGATKPKEDIGTKFNTNYLGFINDDITLSIIYSAADVFVMPSIQDNFPNTVLESLSCGTPVVSFGIGGNPDMIEHKINGYLAKPFEPADLAEGIRYVLSSDEKTIYSLNSKARQKVEDEYNAERISKMYLGLFEELVK